MAKAIFDPDSAFKSIVGTTAKEPAGKAIVIHDRDERETRSKRVNLVIKPSVYEMAKKKCGAMNISFNECVNQFLENWIQN